MKRILAALLALLCLTGASAGLAAPVQINAAITVDGIRTAFFAGDGHVLPPLEEDGVLYVPAVSLAESLGMQITADPDTLAVRAGKVRMAFFDEDGRVLSPFVSDGEVYVPLLAFAESAGIRAERTENRYALWTAGPDPAADGTDSASPDTPEGAIRYADIPLPAEMPDPALDPLYQAALEQVRAGEYDEAVRSFLALGAYRDSPAQAENARRQKAEHIRVVPDFRVLDLGCFFHGLAGVQDESGKWGVINTEGQIAIPCQYDETGDFYHGYATVRIGEGENRQVGAIDPTGAFIIPLGKYQDIGTFNEGLARVKSDGKYGYINASDEMVIPCIYEDANYFIDGLASVKKDGLWGAVDTAGKTVVPFRFRKITVFHEGIARTWSDDGKKVTYIDTAGRALFGRTFPAGNDFHDGLALVADHYDKNKGAWVYQYIDKTGKARLTIRDPNTKQLQNFCNGYAWLQHNGRLGIIDHSGTFTVPTHYHAIHYLTVPVEGDIYFAVRNEEGRWGIIDSANHTVFPFEYDDAEAVNEGYALAVKGTTLYVLKLPESRFPAR